MRYSIENECIKVEIESHGAELKSIIKKDNGQEIMWEADPKFWGKTSPILFPFIGKLEGEKYRYNGKEYTIEKHGFARDMDFEVKSIVQDDNNPSMIFAIKSNGDTLKKYPFPFELQVEYRLDGFSVSEIIRVKNEGEDTMYFSLGGHPAFACPLVTDGERFGNRNTCKVKIYGVKDTKELNVTKIDISTGLIPGETYTLATEDSVFPIVDHIFDSDALVLADQGVTAVGLLDKEGKEYVRLEASKCPVWGIWSMPATDASYVCIEPWWGICDTTGYAGTLQERPFTNSMAAGEVWEDGFKICVTA